MSTLERAIIIAAEAHAGQFDKAGEPYILHPLRVMLAMNDQVARTVAVLHDVLEDCPSWTTDRLRENGIPMTIVSAVVTLTKREGDAYRDFIDRCADDPVTRMVKLADVVDNQDETRLAKLPADLAERFRTKYRNAAFRLRYELWPSEVASFGSWEPKE